MPVGGKLVLKGGLKVTSSGVATKKKKKQKRELTEEEKKQLEEQRKSSFELDCLSRKIPAFDLSPLRLLSLHGRLAASKIHAILDIPALLYSDSLTLQISRSFSIMQKRLKEAFPSCQIRPTKKNFP